MDIDEVEEFLKNKKGVVVENAIIKYDEYENYDYTISSNFIIFENEEDAKKYIYENICENHEFYLYKNYEDLCVNAGTNVFICNELLRKGGNV